MAQVFYYPPVTVSATSPSTGTNGAVAPAFSTEVAGIDRASGFLQPINVDALGNQNVNVILSVLPTGAATAANQVTANTSLASIDGKTPTVGQKAMAASSPVVIASDQSTLPISAASLPLPAGAATAAKQPALGTAGTPSADVLTVQGAPSMTALKVDGSAVTQPISAAALPLPAGASTAAKQPALGTAGTPSADVITVQGAASMTALKVDGSAVTQPVSAAALPLPAGAATSALQTALNAQIPTTLGQKTMAASLAVVLASDQSSINTKPAGRAVANAPVRNDYTSVPVTTGAFVQLVASTTLTANKIQVFDSSGQTLALAVGAAAAEVIQCYIFPGGQGDIELTIPSGSRVSIKAVSATASVGELDINFLT